MHDPLSAEFPDNRLLNQQVFDYAISSAHSEDERVKLIETKRVCEIVRAIESAADRKAFITILEQYRLRSDLADDLVDCEIIPFTIMNSQTH